MKQKIQIFKSGISLVDETWGGFYRGGTYLLIGPRKSGRTLVGLQYAMECAAQKEVCLYFTSMRPKDLMIQAASIDFDLQYYMNKNLIIVVRVAPPADLYDEVGSDEFLAEYLNDIVTVVDQYQPNKIVFDELTPFIGFSDIDMLTEVFLQTTEVIENLDITSLFLVGEPATQATQAIVNALASNVTGIIQLKKIEDEEIPAAGGEIKITPNIGHTEGKFFARYHIEPYKGVVIDHQPYDKNKKFTYAAQTPNLNHKYKSLAEMDLPVEKLISTNYYSIEDFHLILNNQIALYKSTGQVFTIISFKLEKEAEARGLLTLTQLQNAIRLSTDRKDKICIWKDKVIVLITKEDQKTINSLIGKIKSNLPSNDSNYLQSVLQYISVYALKIDEKIQKAEDIFTHLTSDEKKVKKDFRFQ